MLETKNKALHKILNRLFSKISMRKFSLSTLVRASTLTLPLIFSLSLMHGAVQAHCHHRSHHRSDHTATYYTEHDSNPHLSNGDWYGVNNGFFLAVDESKRRLLNHDIMVINKKTGRSHVFLAADLGKFDATNVDISCRGSRYMNEPSRHAPDNFRVMWYDMGLNREAALRHRHGGHHRKHRHSG